MSDLAYKRTNVYEKADESKLKEIFDYAEGYRTFLDEAKTEREACAFVEEEAKKQGYKPFRFGMQLKAGDKVYYNNRGKNSYLIRVGTKSVAEHGVRIVQRRTTMAVSVNINGRRFLLRCTAPWFWKTARRLT